MSITTPAAGKIYRSERPIAHVAQRLHVAPGAILEWLPQETIYFSGAQAHSHTRVELAADAGFIGWEIACLGRPAAQEQFAAGAVRAGLELWRDGVPLYIERAHFHGGDSALMARWALDGCSVTGTLLALARDEELVRALRTELAAFAAPDRFAVTQADDVLVVVDPHSGLSFEVAAYKGYMKRMIEVRCLYQWKAWKPDAIALLLG